MRALILYAILVIIGTVVAAFAGLFVEREITDAGSVVVFIGLFFAQFLRVLGHHPDGGRAHHEGVGGGRGHSVRVRVCRPAGRSAKPADLVFLNLARNM